MPIPKPVQALFKWTPSGFGVFLVIHFALAQDMVQALIAAFGTGLTALWVKFSDGFMREAEQQAEQRGGSFAKWVFVLFDNLVVVVAKQTVQAWREATSRFERRYYDCLSYEFSKFKVEGLNAHTNLRLEHIFVEVTLSLRSDLSQISPNLLKDSRCQDAPETEPIRAQRIGDFLAAMQKDGSRRLAILGAPGSGKTTLMRYLALMYVNRTPHQLHAKAPQFIPILLYLRDVYPWILENPEMLLEDLILRWVQTLKKRKPLNPPSGWFAKRIERCLILLDGLDEIADDTQRNQISRWVDNQMRDYNKTPFILTSRKIGYQKAQLEEGVTVLEVDNFDDGQIEQFVHNWYLALEAKNPSQSQSNLQDQAEQQANHLITEIQQQSNLREMASNPLLLTMIATVHCRYATLPLKRVELYREICQVLLEKRQRAKFKGKVDILSADQKQSVLQPLALDLTRRKTLEFTLDDVRPLLAEKLAMLPGNARTPETFLEQVRDVDALMAKDEENVFQFSHRSFQEYLSATELTQLNDSERTATLQRVVEAPDALEWWADTLRLYAEQTDVSQFIAMALQQPTFATLLLAIDCWQLGRTQPTVQQRLLDEISKPLAVLDPATLALAREKHPHYFKLAHYLQTGQWRKADYETYRAMITTVGKEAGQVFSVDDLLTFPCEDLKVIDSLWVKYSHGKFGFSVQKQIYVDCGAMLDGQYPGNKIFDDFAKRVGWRGEKSWLDYDNLKGDLNLSPPGEFPRNFQGNFQIFKYYNLKFKHNKRLKFKYQIKYKTNTYFSFLALRLVKCSISQS